MSSLPRYRAIQDALAERIISGAWPPGHKLPSEPELALSFDCARMTISKALGVLATRGLITRRRRAGTVVNAPRPQESVLEIHDIETEVLSSGHDYHYERLHREQRPASATDATAIDVEVGTPLLVLTGLHRTDNQPHALEERLINLLAVPAAKRERFEGNSPGRWLLAQVPWTQASHEITALNANRAIARTLQIAEHKACLCIERRTWQGEQRITYVRLIYPCDQHRLVARFQPSGL